MTATTVIPTSPSELEEFIQDTAKLSAAVADPAAFKELVASYVKAFHQKNEDFQDEVKELVQLELAKFQDEHGATRGRLDLAPGGGNKVPTGPNAPGAKADKLFIDHADFLRSTWYRNQTPDAVAKQEQLREIRNSFGSTIPADGGFLIPETLRATLLRVALESAVVRPRATVIPMDSLRVPFPTIDSSSNVSSVFGGMIGYWTEEAGELALTKAKFGRTVLEAKKLTGYSEVPNELFTDSIVSFAAFLSQVWPQAIAFFEDVACIKGTGVGEPLGVLNGTAGVLVTRANANQVGLPDIAQMYARMLPGSLMTAVWLASPAVMTQLLQLTTGTGGVPLWLTAGTLNGAPTLLLLGRPLIVTEKVPDLGTTGDLDFVDFGYYLLGDRQAMSMESSPHYKFANDVTAVRIIERVDGRPWLNSAITPNNGGAALSPIVKLGPAA